MMIACSIAAYLLTALAVDATATIERVAWMQGCWQMDAGPRVVEEQWMAPRGGVMLGMGRTVRDGKLVEYESDDHAEPERSCSSSIASTSSRTS